jgi:hypothetical protein
MIRDIEFPKVGTNKVPPKDKKKIYISVRESEVGSF